MGADVVARENVVVPVGKISKVPLGIWISWVDENEIPEDTIPELQLRLRSSLAYKHNLFIPNGVGTIDMDYREEICLLVGNFGNYDYTIQEGDRVGQLIQVLTYRIKEIPVTVEERIGGFGSTGE